MDKPEQWRTIPKYPMYEASDAGRIRRAVGVKFHPTVRILRQALDAQGYCLVTMYTEGKQLVRKVHQLVMEAFVGPRPEGFVTNHIDATRAHNAITNLEYVTPRQNAEHTKKLGRTATGDRNAMRKYPEKVLRGDKNGNATLPDFAIRVIKAELCLRPSIKEVAEEFGISVSMANHIKHGRARRHVDVTCGMPEMELPAYR